MVGLRDSHRVILGAERMQPFEMNAITLRFEPINLGSQRGVIAPLSLVSTMP
jgi:hypothetical protein